MYLPRHPHSLLRPTCGCSFLCGPHPTLRGWSEARWRQPVCGFPSSCMPHPLVELISDVALPAGVFHTEMRTKLYRVEIFNKTLSVTLETALCGNSFKMRIPPTPRLVSAPSLDPVESAFDGVTFSVPRHPPAPGSVTLPPHLGSSLLHRHQWQAAATLASQPGHSVDDSGRNHRNRWLASSRWFLRARHDMDIHRNRCVDDVGWSIGVEVALLHITLL